MSGLYRLRNATIAAMLSDGEQIKNFYRFIAQNPHINLRDASQIISERPNATVCFTFNEWNAMGRRVTKGRNGIAYYDYDGYKQFVFDANDTHGDSRYQRLILSMKHLLAGLDELNGTNLADDERSDYRKIKTGVHRYLNEQGELTGDDIRDGLMIEEIAFSLYSKTGFPKSAGIRLSGLPYSYAENADFVKEVYIQTAALSQEIEDAYYRKRNEVKVIDDTDEETKSDEANNLSIPEEITNAKESEEQPTVSPYYQKYLDAQKLKPQAVVLMRLGDFYEVMGENAKAASSELDLTLTGREVGLPERVPMCGMPYHAMDRYLEKILERHGVLLVDGDEEPKYILSREEAAQERQASKRPKVIEVDDDEPNPFDSEQSEIDDDSSDEDDFPADDEDISEKEQEETPKPTPKKQETGIKERKRKQKPQVSLFDLIEKLEKPKEKSAEEALIERQLKYGSGVEHGKFRIFDKYNENPPAKVFEAYLKNEYGWGGHGGWNGDDEMHDGKGITMSVRGAKGEYLVQVHLNWSEVATRIADLIDDDNYLSEQDKREYVRYKVEQNRLRELRAEEERQKNEHINNFILSASDNRKQRILDEYAITTKIVDFAEFLKNEYGTVKETGETYSITYNEMGIWMFKNGDENDYRNRTYLQWEEFADKVCSLIENDRYIEQREPRDLDAEEDEDWDRLIDAGILKPVEPTRQTDEHELNRFKELSAEDRSYFEIYTQRYRREPTESPWDEVQSCTTIANGICRSTRPFVAKSTKSSVR